MLDGHPFLHVLQAEVHDLLRQHHPLFVLAQEPCEHVQVLREPVVRVSQVQVRAQPE